ncbi:diaminopimelate decarboxylase [Novipirellula artificiosorum]|uniref:Diaminopimelate decarboxylase n=1 Tax=Novipirellula artificiosorum TaxID=2528016 RepID=A0A5C6CID1_9BACT|nr:diaminopimelate decarboxylase [Novipirellula artificiosorum]TWU23845.1 Diaminopimelate decarboxylase [Novipirellula artificiosorum]
MSASFQSVSAQSNPPDLNSEWWSRCDLQWCQDRLQFAGRDVDNLSRQFGTRTFFYSTSRIRSNAQRIESAFLAAGFANRYRIHFAMKANRFAPLLCFLKQTGLVGIDACSPNEVEHAIACGFDASEVSFTNTSLSREDLDRLSRIEGLRINCDSLRAIAAWGKRRPGSCIGFRINPGCGVGRADNEKLKYSGSNTTKFGIYREQFADALQLAKASNLTVDTIHFHTGCGYLSPQLEQWSEVLVQCKWFIDQVETLRNVNVGGGLGVPHVASDSRLNLDEWAKILSQQFGDRSELTIEVEPGDYLVKDAGILLLTVGSIERKRGTIFVGVNAGFNIAPEPTVYRLPLHPVPAVRRSGPATACTIAGHINEALDIWYHDIELPPLREEDTLVLLNAGAYSSSMASNHCMRGDFREFLLC